MSRPRRVGLAFLALAVTAALTSGCTGVSSEPAPFDVIESPGVLVD